MGLGFKEDLSVHFSEIADPRIDRRKKYPLPEILFLALYGALLRVESWRGLEVLGEGKLDFLRRFFPFSSGVPSHQTIARVFSLLQPRVFEDFFMTWMAAVGGSNAGKQIALDGKSLKGSADKGAGKAALHLLHACAVENGLCLAQLEVDHKTNEITVAPQLLDALDVQGAMISVDALNTQKEFADKIISKKAQYTLALRGNHKNLNNEVQQLMENPDTNAVRIQEVEKEHGRLVTRRYDLVPVDRTKLSQFSEWAGLQAVGRVQNSTVCGENHTIDTRHYLLSYRDEKLFAKSARSHWGIESKLHWTLDVTFGEDASQKRKDHAPRNFSVIRKMALNIARTFKQKLSVPLFQIKVTANSEYFAEILQTVGFTQRREASF